MVVVVDRGGQHARRRATGLQRRAVVLAQRRLHLRPAGRRHLHAGQGRPAVSAALSPADAGDHRGRPGPVGRQRPLPGAGAAGGPGPDAHRVQRVGHERGLGPVPLPVVWRGAHRAQDGGGQHERRRARARRAAPDRRPQRGRRALHGLHAGQPGPARGHDRALVDRRHRRRARQRPAHRHQDRARAAVLRGAGLARARPEGPVRRLARDDPRRDQPAARRGGALRARAPDAGAAEGREPHRAGGRHGARLQQPAHRHPGQRRVAGHAGAARLAAAARRRGHRDRGAARRRPGIEDAGLLGRRARGGRARRPGRAGARDGGTA